MLFSANQTLVFAGDSITDAGRRGAAAPYGNGYMSMVHSLMLARYPDLRLRFVNRGVSGDTSRDLAARWERDVLAEQPDWLSVMIGINDVWRIFGSNPHEAPPITEYEATLDRLLDQGCNAGAKLILMTPYMIEADQGVAMRRRMDRYGGVVEQLAEKHNAILVRVQAAFDVVLAHTPANNWSDDQIHPNNAGHAVIALAWLQATGFEL